MTLYPFIATAQAASLFFLPNTQLSTNSQDALPSIANRILEVLTAFSYPLAFIGLVYTAYILITSGGKPEAQVAAKKNAAYIATGIFLIVFATVLLRFAIGLFNF